MKEFALPIGDALAKAEAGLSVALLHVKALEDGQLCNADRQFFATKLQDLGEYLAILREAVRRTK
jgi:hypothetical protein